MLLLLFSLVTRLTWAVGVAAFSPVALRILPFDRLAFFKEGVVWTPASSSGRNPSSQALEICMPSK